MEEGGREKVREKEGGVRGGRRESGLKETEKDEGEENEGVAWWLELIMHRSNEKSTNKNNNNDSSNP